MADPVYNPDYVPTGRNSRDNDYYKTINHRRLARNESTRSSFGPGDEVEVPYPDHIFDGGVQGVRLDASDLSTMWQDEAKTTPVLVHGDPVGYWADKSPNGAAFTQPVAVERPIYQTDGTYHWVDFGPTSRIRTPVVIVGALAVELVYAARNTELDGGSFIVISRVSSASPYALYGQKDTNAAAEVNAGTPVYRKNGVVLPAADRAALYTAFPTGEAHVMGAANIDMLTSPWGNIQFGGWNSDLGGLAFDHRLYGCTLVASTSEQNRLDLEAYYATILPPNP